MALLTAAIATQLVVGLVAPTPRRSRVTVAADMSCDCAVIGAGPAGAVIAWLLAERGGLEVALVDPSIDRPWPNNCNGRCPKGAFK